ncbi:MAG: hypothetical protein KAT00_12725, partial [Planctomycetes bacterium]|nr:hypothetical protein [Planctomycetota bacterium]
QIRTQLPQELLLIFSSSSCYVSLPKIILCFDRFPSPIIPVGVSVGQVGYLSVSLGGSVFGEAKPMVGAGVHTPIGPDKSGRAATLAANCEAGWR